MGINENSSTEFVEEININYQCNTNTRNLFNLACFDTREGWAKVIYQV